MALLGRHFGCLGFFSVLAILVDIINRCGSFGSGIFVALLGRQLGSFVVGIQVTSLAPLVRWLFCGRIFIDGSVLSDNWVGLQ